MDNFNKTELLFKYVDNKIENLIKSGYNIHNIIIELERSNVNFISVYNGIDLSDKIQLSRSRYLFTRIKVMEKRIADFYFLETLQHNFSEYAGYKVDKLFRLLKFRDKLIKFRIEIPI